MKKLVLNLIFVLCASIASAELATEPRQLATLLSEPIIEAPMANVEVNEPMVSDQFSWCNFLLNRRVQSSVSIVQPISSSSPVGQKLYEGSAAKYQMNGNIVASGNMSFSSSVAIESGYANGREGRDDPFGPPGEDNTDKPIDGDNFIPVGDTPWVLILLGAIVFAVRKRKETKLS